VIQTVQPWAQSPKEASREGLDALPHLMEYSTGALANNNKNSCQMYFVKVQGTSTKKQFGRKKMLDKNVFFEKKYFVCHHSNEEIH
jgi:hypothetical protein